MTKTKKGTCTFPVQVPSIRKSIPVAHEVAIGVDTIDKMGSGAIVHGEHRAGLHVIITPDAFVFQLLPHEAVLDGNHTPTLRGAGGTIHDLVGELADVDAFAGLADLGYLIEVHEGHAVAPSADEHVSHMHFHVGGGGLWLATFLFGAVDAEVLTSEPRVGLDGLVDEVLDTLHGSPVLTSTEVIAASDVKEIVGDIHPTIGALADFDFEAEHSGFSFFGVVGFLTLLV